MQVHFFQFMDLLVSVTSEAAEAAKVDHIRIKIVAWNFTVTFLGISTVLILMTMRMDGSGDKAKNNKHF